MAYFTDRILSIRRSRISHSVLMLILHFYFSLANAAEGREVIGPFGGLNNSESSYVINPEQASDLLNVDLSDGAKSIKKRKGYGTAFTLSDATSPVHGTYFFYDTDGSDVVLAFNGRHVNRSISGAAPSVIYTSATNNATWQCIDAEGFAYCANTGRDAIFKIDASAISKLSGFTSTGTMVAVTPERLVQAGFSLTPNRIDFSKSNDFATWAVGGNPTDPIQFTITSPGSGIKHIVYAHGRIYWFKDSSFGYILEGATQSDWRVVTIDAFIGTLDNASIYNDEILYFRDQNSEFYAYDGSNLVKISKDIHATILTCQGTQVRDSWTQTDTSDWDAGYFDSSVYVDTTTTVGLIATSFPDNFGVFRDGSNNTKKVWYPLARETCLHPQRLYLMVL